MLYTLRHPHLAQSSQFNVNNQNMMASTFPTSSPSVFHPQIKVRRSSRKQEAQTGCPGFRRSGKSSPSFITPRQTDTWRLLTNPSTDAWIVSHGSKLATLAGPIERQVVW
jgi:hypothetical protein